MTEKLNEFKKINYNTPERWSEAINDMPKFLHEELREWKMEWTVDFCGFCGTLVPEGVGCEEDPRCDNCDNDITERKHRIQGKFTDKEAQRLFKACYP